MLEIRKSQKIIRFWLQKSSLLKILSPDISWRSYILFLIVHLHLVNIICLFYIVNACSKDLSSYLASLALPSSSPYNKHTFQPPQDIEVSLIHILWTKKKVSSGILYFRIKVFPYTNSNYPVMTPTFKMFLQSEFTDKKCPWFCADSVQSVATLF